MRPKRAVTIDELAQARAARAPMVADCDTPGCGARGVFDTINQMAGWFIDGRDRHAVAVLCPRCNDNRRKTKP